MCSRLGRPQPRDVAINHHTRSNYIDLEPEEKHLQRYPSLDWTSDNFAMTYRLLETLEQYHGLRQTVCSEGRKSVTGTTKSDAYREIAVRVLEVFPAYAIYVGDAAGDGAKHYGPCVRNKIFALQAQNNSTREILGVARTGLPAEWEDGEAWNSVKQTCPYFLRLGNLVGNGTNVGDHPIKKRKRKARRVDLTGSGEATRTHENEKPDDMENENGASSDATGAHGNGRPDTTRARENRKLDDMEDDDDGEYEDGVSSDSTSETLPRRNQNGAAPRRFLVDPRPQNVDNPVAASSLNSPPAVVNPSSTTRTGTNAHSPQNAADNRTRATRNLKRKAAVGELGNGLSTVAKPAKKRRRVRDKNVENSRGELRGGVTQQLEPDVRYDLRVAELEEQRAKRKLAEKRAEREYQLQMRRLELLEKCIAPPANHLPATNANDKKEKSVVVSPNASRHGPGQPEEGTLEHGPEKGKEAETRDDDLYGASGEEA